MEPTATYATRKGNLSGETIAMSVDTASMAHVLSVLTDLYSDPTLAVIREYSTNALDSHVEAGVKRPIDVSLPNAMTPFSRFETMALVCLSKIFAMSTQSMAHLLSVLPMNRLVCLDLDASLL